ncbi:AraC family transcriptional regulator [Clostridiales bacterium COT073_COT-073]|nr:AraC family transcriptional regulator [Clostridiales bacterium COT073_COT-073]
MRWDMPVFNEQTVEFNKVYDGRWDTFRGLGKIGEYRVLAQTEDCVVIRVENDTGEGDMILYQVFDGVFLMYNDFHMSAYASVYQAVETMLAVDYCREGSLALELDNGMYYMKKAGNVCIDSRVHHRGMNYFPTNHYHGITIGFVNSLAEKAISQYAAGIPINLAEIRRKFCGEDGYFIIQEEETLKRLFTDLYRVPDKAKLPYFRVKVLELLVCLSVIEAKNIKEEGSYFYKDKVEKTRAVQKLISENIEQDYTIKGLAEQFEISQTALKECFKSLYGKPIYTWLKEYRIGKAREYLTEREDMSIIDIAIAVGYKSQAKFGAVFKKICGMTPKEYRNQRH